MRALIVFLLCCSPSVFALEVAGLFVDPHVAVGYNVAQGTYVLGGLDVGYYITDQVAAGVGAYYAAGHHPDDDRETGGGPFVAFTQPIVPAVLSAHVREDLDYVDQRNPIEDAAGVVHGHDTLTGVASITTVGLHVRVGPVFGISGGYRAVLPMTNSDLGKNRSGAFLGFSIGI